MQQLNEFKSNNLKTSAMRKIYAGQELETTIGDQDKPSATDIHYDNDNDNTWSEGDQLKVTLKENK